MRPPSAEEEIRTYPAAQVFLDYLREEGYELRKREVLEPEEDGGGPSLVLHRYNDSESLEILFTGLCRVIDTVEEGEL